MKIMLLVILFQMMLVSSCRTNTTLDRLMYDSEIVSVPNISAATGTICTALEAQGHNLSDFAMDDLYTQINYPDGTSTRHFLQTSIGSTLLTNIDRDFETNTVSDKELELQTQIARDLCFSIAQQAEEWGLSSYDIALRMLDPISGVTVIFNTAEFDGDCDQLRMGSVGFGAYGQSSDSPISVCS